MENQIINVTEENFTALASSHNDVNFEQECHFALQILKGNDYSMKIAKRNPESLQMAIRNVAAIGVSLNPAACHAYLIPRKGAIVLDVGYRGMAHLAHKGGSVDWVKAELVYKGETFVWNGIDEKPTHIMDPFSPVRDDIGKVVGVYVVAKVGNSYLCDNMTISQVYAIRDRASESWKSGKNSPWKSDPGEMIKKTVIKRAAKLWPRVERLQKAVEVVNQHEGIDFENEGLNIDDALNIQVKEKAFYIDNGEERIIKLVERAFKVSLSDGINSFAKPHAKYAISFLDDFISKQEKEKEESTK